MAIKVGFIGLGNMGNPMATNVMKGGFALTVYDLNARAMENLVAAGASPARSAAELARSVDVLLTCLPGSPEVESLYLGTDGLIECAQPGSALVDMSSVLPSTPRKLEPLAKARDLQFLEAPVSGGVTGARAATLAIMTGGDAPVLERVRPILCTIGPNIYHVGPVGAGNTIKAINNMMSSCNALTMMEGMMVGLKAGLDLATMHAVIKDSRTLPHPAQLRARLQGAAHEQGSGDVPYDREGAARARELRQHRTTLPAGGARRRFGRDGHERRLHLDRKACWRRAAASELTPSRLSRRFARQPCPRAH
jgi:3-hydroxyisobutyrate dehydrogenase-like beta-hydroxyacid dehydrogenase